jgi:hypothetical protein
MPPVVRSYPVTVAFLLSAADGNISRGAPRSVKGMDASTPCVSHVALTLAAVGPATMPKLERRDAHLLARRIEHATWAEQRRGDYSRAEQRRRDS